MILLMILGLVMAQERVVVDPSAEPLLKLEKTAGGFGVSNEIEISFHARRSEEGAVWLVHVRRDYSGPPGQEEKIDRWLDERACDAVVPAAEALRDFRGPQASEPGDPRGALMAPHGMRLVLTTTGVANGGQATTVTTDLTGQVLGELADSTLSRLRACL